MKNIKNKILIFGLSSMILGCSQSATSVFEKNPIYGQNIQYSKVIKVVEKENVNAIFNITYLNSVDSWKWNDDQQHFLIGTYTIDNNASQYKLTMNDMEPISKKEVTKENELFKNIAFRNHWGKYNIVSFEDSDEKNLTLVYKYGVDNNISTTFIKE
ncbi:MAG: hypothetical protein WBG69_08980 [Arcobacteraceae bacterium]